jgi:hypothetical protein
MIASARECLVPLLRCGPFGLQRAGPTVAVPKLWGEARRGKRILGPPTDQSRCNRVREGNHEPAETIAVGRRADSLVTSGVQVSSVAYQMPAFSSPPKVPGSASLFIPCFVRTPLNVAL